MNKSIKEHVDTGDNFMQYSLEDEGIYMLWGEITENSSREVNEWIIRENMKPRNKHKHLTLMINSPGGNVSDGLSIIDCMNQSRIPIHTVATGVVASMGLVIFMSGVHRKSTANTIFMSHEVWGVAAGTVHGLVTLVDSMKWLQDRLIDIYVKNTKLTKKRIQTELIIPNEDIYFDVVKAKKFNICDEIVK